MKAFCRACDKAVDAAGEWPGSCGVCGTAIEADPVPDVVRDDLRILFVGINPGVQTARARHHFANPQNAFWPALGASAMTRRRLDPEHERELLEDRLGLTNVVTRATPGSGDITAEDIARGRRRLKSLVGRLRPELLAFVGKQAYYMASGEKRVDHGEQDAPLFGRRVFVLPSTSPANASVSRDEKVQWFRRLAQASGASK